jgi:hypothetical protein
MGIACPIISDTHDGDDGACNFYHRRSASASEVGSGDDRPLELARGLLGHVCPHRSAKVTSDTERRASGPYFPIGYPMGIKANVNTSTGKPRIARTS